FAKAVSRARRVICVTRSTRDQLLGLPVKSAPCDVVYEGVGMNFFEYQPIAMRQKVRMYLGTDKPYLLYVGVWMSHKNLQRLLSAFVRVRRRFPDLRLVITGRPV